jgi:hypothetical protein
MRRYMKEFRKHDSISLDDIKSDAVGLLHGTQTWNIPNSSYSTAMF